MTFFNFTVTDKELYNWNNERGFLNLRECKFEGTLEEVQEKYNISESDIENNARDIYFKKLLLNKDVLNNLEDIVDWDWQFSYCFNGEYKITIAITWSWNC